MLLAFLCMLGGGGNHGWEGKGGLPLASPQLKRQIGGQIGVTQDPQDSYNSLGTLFEKGS